MFISELEGKTVYIAGAMRGHDLYNFPAFDAMEGKLRRWGVNPISPAAIDKAFGFNPYNGDVLDDDVLPSFARACIQRDIAAICSSCDACIVLFGSENSTGVAVEVALCKFLGLPVYYEEEVIWSNE